MGIYIRDLQQYYLHIHTIILHGQTKKQRLPHKSRHCVADIKWSHVIGHLNMYRGRYLLASRARIYLLEICFILYALQNLNSEKYRFFCLACLYFFHHINSLKYRLILTKCDRFSFLIFKVQVSSIIIAERLKIIVQCVGYHKYGSYQQYKV